MKLDILAFGAHPDDVELSAGGCLAKMKDQGKTTGIIDLTQGELGTRGTPEIRAQESQAAAKILGLSIRENLKMPDGFISENQESLLAIIESIRKYKPTIILTNAPADRHTDHGAAGALVKKAAFLSGLRKIETDSEAWRPKLLFHYIQWWSLKEDFILDISDYLETKLEACMAYSSQFFDPNTNQPETPISSKNFQESIAYRAKDLGRLIGVHAGEGFIKSAPLGVSSFDEFIGI